MSRAAPVVRVPVLSNRIAAISASRSSASPLRNNTRSVAAFPKAAPDGQGRCQAESTRARDQRDSQASPKPGRERTERPVDSDREDGNRENGWNKAAGDAIGQSVISSFRFASIAHHRDQPGERSLFASGAHPYGQIAVKVERAAQNAIAWLLEHGPALACEHLLIGEAAVSYHSAIHRKTFAR